MNLNVTAAESPEVPSRPRNEAKVATKVIRKSFTRRILDKMAANAKRQAFARLAATDPRMANDLSAAWDRAIEETSN